MENGNMPGAADTSSAATRTVDQVTSGAHKAIDRASETVHPAVDRMASGAHQTVDRIAGAASQAAGTFDLKSEQLMDAQARLTDNCRGYIQENPLASLGIAVAAGFLLSRLVSSR